MNVQYYLERAVSATTGINTEFEYPSIDGSLDLSILEQLNDTLHECNKPTIIPGLYNSLIRLITTGVTYKASPFFFTDSDGGHPYRENITLTMVCDNTKAMDTNDIYWKI